MLSRRKVLAYGASGWVFLTSSFASKAGGSQAVASAEAFGAKAGEDCIPAINKALAWLKSKGGGRLIFPEVGGYEISTAVIVDFSNCHIELHDDIKLKTNVKSSAIVFEGQPDQPLEDVSIVGLGKKRKIDANGRSMLPIKYDPKTAFYSCVLFRHCTGWSINQIYAFNGLVNCIRAFQCGPGAIISCDASDSEYDNGHTVDFDPSWIGWNDGSPRSWSRAQITNCRAWRCKGLGIASYAATAVTIDSAEVWDCGNDEAGHPNNGGGISIEGNVGDPNKPDKRDHRGTIKNSKIRDCWNQGIHISAAGSSLISTSVSNTRRPNNKRNAFAMYGSNIILFGAATLRCQGVAIVDGEAHGIALHAAVQSMPKLSFAGTVAQANGSCLWGEGVASVSVSNDTHMNAGAALGNTSAVMIDNTSYNLGASYVSVSGTIISANENFLDLRCVSDVELVSLNLRQINVSAKTAGAKYDVELRNITKFRQSNVVCSSATCRISRQQTTPPIITPIVWQSKEWPSATYVASGT